MKIEITKRVNIAGDLLKGGRGWLLRLQTPLVASWVLSGSPGSPFCSSNDHTAAGNLGCASTLTNLPLTALLCVSVWKTLLKEKYTVKR